jgi:hypothetical protein
MGPKKYRCSASETGAYNGIISNQKSLYFSKRLCPFVTVGGMGRGLIGTPMGI